MHVRHATQEGLSCSRHTELTRIHTAHIRSMSSVSLLIQRRLRGQKGISRSRHREHTCAHLVDELCYLADSIEIKAPPVLATKNIRTLGSRSLSFVDPPEIRGSEAWNICKDTKT